MRRVLITAALFVATLGVMIVSVGELDPGASMAAACVAAPVVEAEAAQRRQVVDLGPLVAAMLEKRPADGKHLVHSHRNGTRAYVVVKAGSVVNHQFEERNGRVMTAEDARTIGSGRDRRGRDRDDQEDFHGVPCYPPDVYCEITINNIVYRGCCTPIDLGNEEVRRQ
jgi:hypothetical protein